MSTLLKPVSVVPSSSVVVESVSCGSNITAVVVALPLTVDLTDKSGRAVRDDSSTASRKMLYYWGDGLPGASLRLPALLPSIINVKQGNLSREYV